MALKVSTKVRAKLSNKTPPVTLAEIGQCFANRQGGFLLDDREEHRSDPPTRWFIAETDFGRKLKVAFILTEEGDVIIRTAYDPNPTELAIYTRLAT